MKIVIEKSVRAWKAYAIALVLLMERFELLQELKKGQISHTLHRVAFWNKALVVIDVKWKYPLVQR